MKAMLSGLFIRTLKAQAAPKGVAGQGPTKLLKGLIRPLRGHVRPQGLALRALRPLTTKLALGLRGLTMSIGFVLTEQC